MKFIKGCRDEANSNFGRLLESVRMDSRPRKERESPKGKMQLGTGRANASSAGMGKVNDKPPSASASREDKCSCCEAMVTHGLWRFPRFLALQVSKECTSGFTCRECGLPHNKLLHVGKDVQAESGGALEEAVKSNVVAACGASTSNSQRVGESQLLLPSRPRTRLKVLPVRVKNVKTGAAREVLAFLDGVADCH